MNLTESVSLTDSISKAAAVESIRICIVDRLDIKDSSSVLNLSESVSVDRLDIKDS